MSMPQSNADEIARLERMLAASQGLDGYRQRVVEIEKRLAELRS